MSDGPLNEAKALDMVGLKSKIVGPAILSSRRLQQSTLPVETHIINTHADGPSQFDKSERPRSHLPPQTNAPPAPGTHQTYTTPPALVRCFGEDRTNSAACRRRNSQA